MPFFDPDPRDRDLEFDPEPPDFLDLGVLAAELLFFTEGVRVFELGILKSNYVNMY